MYFSSTNVLEKCKRIKFQDINLLKKNSIEKTKKKKKIKKNKNLYV